MVLAVLREFWHAGVPKVSAGALGMKLRGEPFTDDEARLLIRGVPGCHWINEGNSGWIVEGDE